MSIEDTIYRLGREQKELAAKIDRQEKDLASLRNALDAAIEREARWRAAAGCSLETLESRAAAERS